MSDTKFKQYGNFIVIKEEFFHSHRYYLGFTPSTRKEGIPLLLGFDLIGPNEVDYWFKYLFEELNEVKQKIKKQMEKDPKII
jgi:hypothetical protein